MRIGTIHQPQVAKRGPSTAPAAPARPVAGGDRKSTRLNSSHDQISYAVFCLKKKKAHEVAATSAEHGHGGEARKPYFRMHGWLFPLLLMIACLGLPFYSLCRRIKNEFVSRS